MLTAVVVLLALFCVFPLVGWVLGIVFKLLGWTMRAAFSLLGILLLPVAILAFLAQGAVVLLPLVLAFFIYSEALND